MSGQNSSPQFDVDSNDAAGAPPSYVFNTKVMVGAIILLVGVICFILMLHVYAKWFLRRSSRSYIVNQRHIAQHSAATTGLDKAAISQLPTFVYTAPASPFDNSDQAGNLHQTMPAPECAVCLSEFQENEKGRMLPSCKHIFHTECIDMWLFSHTTCPLCRSNVVPPTTEIVSTDQQHQEQEATEPSQGTAEANPGMLLHPVEYPCNVLFWGNQTQVIASQEPLTSSYVAGGARPLPQITIDIPPREGNVLVGASGCLSATKLTVDQEAGCSHPLQSPSLRASIKRMLSRQSSRQKSPGQEGNTEISPK